MIKFSIKKKGYNPSEVDDYSLKAEQHLLAQKERIQKLKNRVAILERELLSYHEKKDLIMAALAEAVKKAEEIEQQANKKYDLEIQRLRQFHAKWTEYYDKLIKKFPATSKSVDDFNRDMDKILKESEWYSDSSTVPTDSSELLYKKEKKRLEKRKNSDDLKQNSPEKAEENKDTKNSSTGKSGLPLTPLEMIKKYLDGGYEDAVSVLDSPKVQPQEEEAVFNLEEALHPKQDLEGIMRDLGLIED